MTTPVIPGTQIVSRAAPPSGGGASRTGTWHVAVLAERGPTDLPRLLASLSDYDKFYGRRVPYGQRDSIEAHFRNGGSRVNLIRIVGPAATKDTATLNDAAGVPAPSIAVDSVGEGATDLEVDVDAGPTADTFILHIFFEGNVSAVQSSPPLASPADAVSWAADSPYVRIRALGAANPAPTAARVALAGGNDDRAAITDTHRIAAVNRIPKSDGEGQVSIPGATTSAAHVALKAHGRVNNRFAILDAVNGASEADLIALANANRAAAPSDDEGYGFLVEGWHTIPGLAPGTTRVVPPSAIVSALMAQRDEITGNPNDPAAGVEGTPSFSLGVARPNWSDAARGRLNAAGVNVFRFVNGAQRLYGYRTLADPNGPSAPWVNAANARLRMAIQADADRLAEPFVFKQITKAKIAEYNGAITGMLLGYYLLGALFGDTPEEAFVVDTGSSVNTPERIAARHLSAVMGLRMSEFAEVVFMEFVKIPVTESI
jgi:hypothetical protein